MMKSSNVMLSPRRKLWGRVAEHWQLYAMLLLPIIYMLLFEYLPFLGVQIAFRKYNGRLGIWGSPWVGFKQFERLFNSYYFGRIMTNTLRLSIYSWLTYPIPIIFALMLNSIRRSRLKNTISTITYMPHFISATVLVGVIRTFFAPHIGLYSRGMNLLFGIDPATMPNILIEPSAFPHLYIWSGVWQNTGWDTIIYIAALTAVSPELHESAILDGASRLQRIRYIDLPAILPTVSVTIIMRVANILGIGFDKVYLLQNTLNASTSEVISTYAWKVGLQGIAGDFSFSTAVSLFQNVVSIIMMLFANFLAKKMRQSNLWG